VTSGPGLSTSPARRALVKTMLYEGDATCRAGALLIVMTKRAFASVLLVLAIALGRVAEAAPPPARTFDIVTFTPPEGWKVDQAADRVLLSKADAAHGWFAIIAIFKGRAASGDLATDFRNEWNDKVAIQVKNAPVPQAQAATVHDGLTGALGAGTGTMADKQVVVTLLVLDAGARVASVLLIVPSAEAMQSAMPTLKTFLAGISVRRGEDDGPQAQQQPPPPSSGGKTIHVEDLAGVWSSSINVIGVYGRTGTYAPSRSVAGATTYTIQPDGSFKMEFHGVMYGRPVSSDDTGRITLEPGKIVFTYDKRDPKVRKYHFVDWIETDQATLLVLLSDVYPNEQGNLIYKETYGRKK
jgi:hypothetical protein